MSGDLPTNRLFNCEKYPQLSSYSCRTDRNTSATDNMKWLGRRVPSCVYVRKEVHYNTGKI